MAADRGLRSVNLHGLPRLEPLVGRAVELESLRMALTQSARLVTVLGPPGIGKTSLACSVVQQLSLEAGFGGGIWFCDLSNVESEQGLRFAVSSTLNQQSMERLGLTPGSPCSETSKGSVAALLYARGRTLIVLDNFEQLCAASHVVQEWLRDVPGLSILVTSRERLALREEMVFELRPLDCPSDEADAETASTTFAVDLFRRRATEAGATFVDDAKTIGQIVRLLDGVPLAIELSAARTRLLTPAELLERLLRGEDLLSESNRRSTRHRSLSDAIAWSWNLLSEEEQKALLVCSVFSGSFSAQAAESLISEVAAGSVAALDLLTSLRDKSLVQVDTGGRLLLLLSIRAFARRRLEERAAMAHAVRLAHARYFAELANRFVRERLFQNTEPHPELHAQVREEKENLVAAWTFCASCTEQATDTRGDLPMLLVALALSHAIPAETADHELASVLKGRQLAPTLQSLVLLGREASLSELGRHGEAVAEAQIVSEMQGVSVGVRAFALTCSGIQLRHQGNVRDALACHKRAHALLESSHLRPLIGMNLACMGRLEADLSNREQARELNARATKICDEMGYRWLAALGLANLAQLEQEAFNFHRAEDLYRRAISRFCEVHELQYEASYAARVGGMYLEWGRPDEALGWLQRSEGCGHLDTPLPGVLLYANWAVLSATRGEFQLARHQLEEARNRARYDGPGVLSMVLELATGAVEVSLLEPDGAVLEEWRSRCRALSDGSARDAHIAQTNLDARFALRLLRARLSRGQSIGSSSALLIGEQSLWFSFASGGRVDLARRGPLRGILEALVTARKEKPGTPLEVEHLTRVGWPDQRILVEAASTRVRVAIATLRKLGLRDVLQTRDAGYLLDPAVDLVRVKAPLGKTE